MLAFFFFFLVRAQSALHRAGKGGWFGRKLPLSLLRKSWEPPHRPPFLVLGRAESYKRQVSFLGIFW